MIVWGNKLSGFSTKMDRNCVFYFLVMFCCDDHTVFSVNSGLLAKFQLKTHEDQSKFTPSGQAG